MAASFSFLSTREAGERIKEGASMTSGISSGVSARMSDRLALFVDNHAVPPTGNTFIDMIEAGLRYSF
jgi:hypothetical protein